MALFDFAADIIKDLGSLGIREVGFLWGVDKELMSLMGTISAIKAVLRDAEKKRTTSNQVKDWLEKLEDAMYDADDLVDEFRTRAALMQENGHKLSRKVLTFFSSSNQLAFKLRMAHRVREIQEKLDKIKDDKDNYKLESLPETPISTKWRETYSYIPHDEVIGRDVDKGNIIEKLFNDDVEENVSVIPIVGMGGLGKTTLAQSVFNDVDVNSYFEFKKWVCVSDSFDLKMILEKMVESCSNNLDQLQNNVRQKLDGKKYLLVLDDVWNEDRKEWIELMNFLKGGARGSKILVTTRTDLVAKITTGGRDEPYRLSALTEETSWSLFEKMAFRQKKEPLCSDSMKKIGMEIVEKCRGVPLAIKTIGSLLFTKTTEAEWLLFKDTEFVKMSQKDDDIIPTLKLSYDNLPSHLKRCFPYCSMFPKDYEINVPTLIQLWMAQGFVIASSRGQCLYDVGYGYFMELLGRSFFQEFKDHSDSKLFPLTCKMHDLMHDLANSVARGCFSWLSTNLENLHDRILRHVHIDLESGMSDKIPKPLLQQKKLRSFIFGRSYRLLRSSDVAPILSNFKDLRALDLSCMKIKTLPSALGKLIHLRYLDLSRSGMKQLPESITGLHNLQTLELSYCSKLLSLPIDIKRLVNLVHLGISYCEKLTHLPCGIGQMTNLVHIDIFGCSKLTYLPRGIGQLTNLVHLDISGCSKMTYLPSGIGQLTSLRRLGWFPVFNDEKDLPNHVAGIDELSCLDNLKGELKITINGHGKHALARCKTENLKRKSLDNLRIYWDEISSKQDRDDSENDEAILDCLQPNLRLKEFVLRWYMGTRVPPWFWSLPNLVKLELFHCHVIKELPSMDQFCGLKELELYGLSELEFVSSRTSGDDTTMPLLESLTIMDCPKLKEWRSIEGNNAATDSEDKCRGSQKRQLSQPVFPSLIRLESKGCPNLISLPLIPNVARLYLSNSIQIEHLLQPIGNNGSLRRLSLEHYESDSLPEDFFKFVSLKLLEIANCFNLTSLSDSIGNLSSLQSISLVDCSNLTSLPDSIGNLSSLQELRLADCSNLTSLSDSIGNLSSLQSISLADCSNLTSLPDSIGNLSSLQELRLTNCSNLASLPDSIGNLSSLQELRLTNCSNLASLSDSIGNLSSLQELRLTNCSNLASLSDSIGNLSSLQELRLTNCSNLTSLPDSISNLSSLQSIYLINCFNLVEFPESIRHLKSLRYLEVVGCPMLEKRCKKNIGEDWPKIAHIPILII